jgi:N-acyl homoserine lactone hydrolase
VLLLGDKGRLTTFPDRQKARRGATMKMHILSGGRLRVSKRMFDAAAVRGETFEVPVLCVLIRHRQGNVLFDTGCHPDAAKDAAARWGDLAKIMTPVTPPEDNVVSALAGVGLNSDDIDIVVCSHLHPDHCGCNAFFKRATFLVNEKEVAAASAPDADAVGYLRADWDTAIPIETFAAERDLFGDGRVVAVTLPGHTPGTAGILTTLDRSGTFFLASDIISLRPVLDGQVGGRGAADPGARRHGRMRARRGAVADVAQGR